MLRSAEPWQNEATPPLQVTRGCMILEMSRPGEGKGESVAVGIGESTANRYGTWRHGSTLQRGLGSARSFSLVIVPARRRCKPIRRKRKIIVWWAWCLLQETFALIPEFHLPNGS